MDYYNFNNAEFDYSVPSTSGGFYEYPFFGHASAVEQTNDAVLGNLENCWDAILQPSPMIGTSTNIWEAPESGRCHCNHFADWCLTHESSEPAAEETPLLSRFEDYSQPSHITCLDPRLLTVDQQPQPEYTGLFNQTYSPNEVRDSSEVSTTIQPLGSGKDTFYFIMSMNQILTDYKQFHLTTGGPIRTSRALAHSIG